MEYLVGIGVVYLAMNAMVNKNKPVSADYPSKLIEDDAPYEQRYVKEERGENFVMDSIQLGVPLGDIEFIYGPQPEYVNQRVLQNENPLDWYNQRQFSNTTNPRYFF